MREKILQEIASFLKYTVQSNIIIECNNKEKPKVKEFLDGLKKDVSKYGGKILIINKKLSKRSREGLLEKNKDKKIILVLDDEFFPSKPRDVDNLFYYLSRLPIEIKETNIILVKSIRNFNTKLSDATRSSLLPKIIDLE